MTDRMHEDALASREERRTEAAMAVPERTAYWGTCDDCLTNVIVYPHVEREDDLPEYDEWERSFPDCPVCDGGMQFQGTDPVEGMRL